MGFMGSQCSLVWSCCVWGEREREGVLGTDLELDFTEFV